MRRGLLNLLSILAALVLTGGAVSLLSTLSQRADPVAQYTEQVRKEEVQVEEFSAPAHQLGEVSFAQGMGAFGVIVAVAGCGCLVLSRSLRKGKAARPGRAYRPKKDMAHTARGRG